MSGTQARPLPGSPQYVIANAAMRAIAGLPPILPFMHFTDPVEALEAAKRLVASAAIEDIRQTAMAAAVSVRDYRQMTDAEIKVAVREIIRTSADVDEAKRRIRDELQYPYEVAMTAHLPTDAIGREAQGLVRALGGLTTRDGALVMAMMHGHDSVLSI